MEMVIGLENRELIMKEALERTKFMVTTWLPTQMDLPIKDFGTEIFKKDKEFRFSQME